jgi:hypothetical protein
MVCRSSLLTRGQPAREVPSKSKVRPSQGVCVHSAHADDSPGLHPNAPEPQSADVRFWVLPGAAKSAYLCGFRCSRLRSVAACCALGSVSSDVEPARIRYGDAPVGTHPSYPRSQRRACRIAPTPTMRHTSIPLIRLIYAKQMRVTDLARTSDLRSHNPYKQLRLCPTMARSVAFLAENPAFAEPGILVCPGAS